MDIGIHRSHNKRAKILATVGPASANANVMTSILKAGANALRCNCSHTSLNELSRAVHLIRATSTHTHIPAAIVLDLQGPRLRAGRLRNGDPVQLKEGGRLVITTDDIAGTDEIVSTNYRDLPKIVSKGSRILLDEGNMELSVLKVSSRDVTCEVLIGGTLREHKGINLPGTRIDLPSLTAKDHRDLEWGLKLDVDYVAVSFVKDSRDIEAARRV